MPMISGGATPGGREARNNFITSSLSAIWLTAFGETKLTASMCLNPAFINAERYSTFVAVGILFSSPCHASRGHSMILAASDNFPPIAACEIKNCRANSCKSEYDADPKHEL